MLCFLFVTINLFFFIALRLFALFFISLVNFKFGFRARRRAPKVKCWPRSGTLQDLDWPHGKETFSRARRWGEGRGGEGPREEGRESGEVREERERGEKRGVKERKSYACFFHWFSILFIFLQSLLAIPPNQLAVDNFSSPLPEPFLRGVKETKWAGRSQRLPIEGHNITIFLDGAHTVESINVCKQWFLQSTER